MKKLSVNRKSFDEIFEQRGAMLLNIESLSFGEIYLFVGRRNTLSIFELGRREGYSYLFNCEIENNGDFHTVNQYHLALDSEIHIATPDQIALLNLYKSQCGK